MDTQKGRIKKGKTQLTFRKSLKEMETQWNEDSKYDSDVARCIETSMYFSSLKTSVDSVLSPLIFTSPAFGPWGFVRFSE